MYISSTVTVDDKTYYGEIEVNRDYNTGPWFCDNARIYDESGYNEITDENVIDDVIDEILFQETV